MADVDERKKKKKKKKKPSSSLLSFGNEEEEGGDGFSGKVDLVPAELKKKEKKKMKAHPLTNSTSVLNDHGKVNTQRSAAGMYSAEALAELKKNSLFLTGTSNKSLNLSQHDPDSHVRFGQTSDEEDEGIPSYFAIKAAKEKRERLRKQGEFISVQLRTGGLEGNRSSPAREEVSTSRLQREDIAHDDDGVFPDEAGSRIMFGDIGQEGSRLPSAREREELGIGNVEVDTANEDDAANVGDRKTLTNGSSTSKRNPVFSRTSIDGARELVVEDVLSRLTATAAALRSNHQKNLKHLEKLKVQESEMSSSTASLREEYSKQGEQYKHFQEMRHFIMELADCLDEKMPLVEEAEERFKHIMRENLSRRQDLSAVLLKEEESDLAFGLPGDSHDESGRQARKMQRMSRRQQRNAIREKNGIHDKVPEGWSSDEDTPEEGALLQSDIQEVITKSGLILADTIDDFSDLKLIKARFMRWKRDYGAHYRDAYISLSVRSVFVPYVRLELVAWNPLESSIYDMKWLQVLGDYGMVDDEELPDNDPDSMLIPDLVQNIALPIVEFHLRECFDVFSSKTNHRARQVIESMADFFDTLPEEYRRLSKAVVQRFSDAIDSLRVPLVPPRSRDAMASVALSQRQFYRALKLLSNLSTWTTLDDFCDRDALQPLCERIVNDRLVPYLSSVLNWKLVLADFEAVLKHFPGLWLSSPSLAPMRDFLSLHLQPLIERAVLDVAEKQSALSRLSSALEKVGMNASIRS